MNTNYRWLVGYKLERYVQGELHSSSVYARHVPPEQLMAAARDVVGVVTQVALGDLEGQRGISWVFEWSIVEKCENGRATNASWPTRVVPSEARSKLGTACGDLEQTAKRYEREFKRG